MKDSPKTYVITDSHFVTRLPDAEKIDRVEMQSRGNFDKKFFFALDAIDLFREEKNAAAGLAAFVYFLEAGIYPPEDLLESLSEGFSDWIAHDGKKDLEKILKLGKQESGKTPSMKKLILLQRDIEIASELRMLIETFGYTQEKAAEMIARRMEQEKVPHAISADTILTEIFPLKKKRERERGYVFQTFDEKEKMEILDRYPTE